MLVQVAHVDDQVAQGFHDQLALLDVFGLDDDIAERLHGFFDDSGVAHGLTELGHDIGEIALAAAECNQLNLGLLDVGGVVLGDVELTELGHVDLELE